jgi:hypothetical protein
MEQSYRPSKDVRDAVIVWSGTTTSAGDAGGTYLVDTGLTQGNNYWINMVVLIKSGNSNGQARRISVFAAGTLTVDTAFASQIASGTKYDILGQHAGLGATAMGNPQVKEISITSDANAGDVTVATVTTQPCIIDSLIIHANAAQTANITTCAVTGGASKVITFISTNDATQANLNAADKQVGWMGAVRLAATKTIVISLLGTPGVNVNLTISITYHAAVSGGYLT